jgi:hypothetical protein
MEGAATKAMHTSWSLVVFPAQRDLRPIVPLGVFPGVVKFFAGTGKAHDMTHDAGKAAQPLLVLGEVQAASFSFQSAGQ